MLKEALGTIKPKMTLFMFKTDEYVNTSNIFAQYKNQLTNIMQVILNQTDHMATLGQLKDIEIV